jgi:hypothetical protein
MQTEYMWLKGLNPASLQTDKLLLHSFDQWGVKKVDRLKDPVTGNYLGHAVVQLRLRSQVSNPCQLFCLQMTSE